MFMPCKVLDLSALIVMEEYNDILKVKKLDKLWVPWFESKLHTCNMCGEMRTCGLSFKGSSQLLGPLPVIVECTIL